MTGECKRIAESSEIVERDQLLIVALDRMSLEIPWGVRPRRETHGRRQTFRRQSRPLRRRQAKHEAAPKNRRTRPKLPRRTHHLAQASIWIRCPGTISAELQEVCRRIHKQCPGFEQVDQILIRPHVNVEGSANWALAAVRPRVDNRSLRAARDMIGFLQQAYRLMPAEVQGRDKRRG